MRSIFVRLVAICLLVAFLVGCGGPNTDSDENQPKLTQTQRQSLAMLNYLTAMTQEITESSNNRLFLEKAYAMLFDNTLPESVDEITAQQINEIANGLYEFRMLEIKREHLNYLHEREQARMLDGSNPDPIEVIENLDYTFVGGSQGEIVGSVLKNVIMIAAMTLSEQHEEEMETQFLSDGWELDDAAEQKLHELRRSAFDYMVTVARENNIPGEYTLTEQTVSDFVQWKNSNNLTGRIQFLESHLDTYKTYGDYWLTLATSYYDNGDYSMCLDAVQEYEKISAELSIFRKDYNYASVLPMYIVSARETYDKDEYVGIAPQKLDLIIKNSDDDDWLIRYFVAEVDVELYHLTQDKGYLEKAYDIMLNLVNTLMGQQQELNKLYLEEVSKVELSENAAVGQKEDAEQYNMMLDEIRKAELPPLSDPLRISAEMLFALADQLDVSDIERDRITKILHNDGADLFYNLIYDNAIRLDPDDTDPTIEEMSITYDSEDGLKLPVVLLTRNSCIKISVGYPDQMIVLEDWKLTKVERQGNDVNSFMAVFQSGQDDGFDFKDDMDLIINIYSSTEHTEPDYTIKFKVIVETILLLIKNVSFQRVY